MYRQNEFTECIVRVGKFWAPAQLMSRAAREAACWAASALARLEHLAVGKVCSACLMSRQWNRLILLPGVFALRKVLWGDPACRLASEQAERLFSSKES